MEDLRKKKEKKKRKRKVHFLKADRSQRGGGDILKPS